MLQRSKANLDVDVGPSTPEHGGLGEFVDFAVGFLLRQYAVILFVAVLAVGAGVTYLRAVPPAYTAQASVLMGMPQAQFVQQQSIVPDIPFDAQQLESQLQVMKSKAVAVSVIDHLKLMEDPEFAPSPPGRMQRLSRWVSRLLQPDASSQQPDLAPDIEQRLIAILEDRVTIKRIGFSYVIEIGFSSRSPQRAAEIANAFANAYIADQLEAKYQANRTASEWLQNRLRELTAQVSTAERAVVTFKAQNDIVAADGKLMDDQRVTDLNGRLVAARTQTSDALTHLNRIDSIVREGADSSLDAAIADALTNGIITNLRQQYLELDRRGKELSARVGPEHLAVVNLRNRMRDIRTSIFDELRRLAETYKGDYEIAKQRQDDIEKQLAQAVTQSRTTNKAQVTLNELDATAKGYRNLYESFLQRYMGSVQQESFPTTEARVISPAAPPTTKSKPKSMLVLALSMVGGLGLGIAFGLFRDIMDRVFRTGAQIGAILQLPCLAVIPTVRSANPDPLPGEQPTPLESTDRLLARDSSVYWTIVRSPLSRFAESIRSIKLAITLNMTRRPNKVVGFTSSLPNEGKSTISASLAHLIAQVGNRVILVDCDLRNPSLSRSLAPGATVGIVDVVSGEKTLEEAVWRDPTLNLVFLPAVTKTPLFHTSEILAAEATKNLFETLRASYDYVIVDLPPLAPVVDTQATTHFVDCFIFVVEWGRTKIDVVRHALSSAPNVYESLIGVVLNKTDMKFMKRYDIHTGDYYRNKHYAQYGYSE